MAGLSKHYGEAIGLDHLDLTIDKGQVYVLLGGKGAGKSTLIRLLSTLAQPDSGTAKLNGYDLLEEPVKVRESIGVAFSGAGLYGRLTLRENLKFFGTLHGINGKQLNQRIDELLHTFNLHDDADKTYSHLSESTKARLAVASAAIHEPKILMIDTPASEPDLVATRIIDQFLTGYANDERTVVKASRSLVEARLLCRKMAVFRHGFLVASGTLSEIEQSTAEKGLREALLELDVAGA